MDNDDEFGMNDSFIPTPAHILPEKKPLHIDELINYYPRFVNGSRNGYYRLSSCPAINSSGGNLRALLIHITCSE